jgi:hypothetical protein
MWIASIGTNPVNLPSDLQASIRRARASKMKVAPAMLLKTRSPFRQFATHPAMFMKTKDFLYSLHAIENKREIGWLVPRNRLFLAALLFSLPTRRKITDYLHCKGILIAAMPRC